MTNKVLDHFHIDMICMQCKIVTEHDVLLIHEEGEPMPAYYTECCNCECIEEYALDDPNFK